MVLDRLDHHRHFIPGIAEAQFNHWGALTGFDSVGDYSTALLHWSTGGDLPVVLVALDGGNLLGSVNLLRSEMTIRPALTPWLAQLFVFPHRRREGVGAALVNRAIQHAGRCGFPAIYLYTSGRLPQYYARLGWDEVERVDYLGRERVIMRRQTTA